VPSKTYGTGQIIEDYAIALGDEEIPSGQYAYVFNQTQQAYDAIDGDIWEGFLNGNVTTLKNEIESQIPNSRVLWIRFYWSRATKQYPHLAPYYYKVEGFKVEAFVENIGGAGLTGLEIVAIIMAVTFAAVVIALVALGSWVTWRVISAAEEISPFATIGVGLVILVILIFALMLILGVRFAGRGFKAGKGIET